MENKPPENPGSEKPLPGYSPKEHGHETWADLFREIRNDEAARKSPEAEFGRMLRGQADAAPQQQSISGEERNRGGNGR